jgi:hypothetical protein
MKKRTLYIAVLLLILFLSGEITEGEDIGAVPADGAVDIGAVQKAPAIGAAPGRVIIISID